MSLPQPAPDVADSTSGRAALLQATMLVGLEQGLSGITSRAVAERAGVAHSLVRYHFGSINALVTEALSFAIDEGRERTRRLGQATDLNELIHRLTASVAAQRSKHAFLYEALLESRRRPGLFPQVQRYFSEHRATVVQQLQRLGVREPVLIDLVCCTVEGISLSEVLYPGQLSSAAAMHRLEQIVELSAEPPLAAVS